MIALLIALQVAVAQPAPALVPLEKPSGRVAKILQSGDGRTKTTAFKVKSVQEEYQILRVYGLEPGIQALDVEPDGRAFDSLTAKNPRTGVEVELWFDISSFFGKEF